MAEAAEGLSDLGGLGNVNWLELRFLGFLLLHELRPVYSDVSKPVGRLGSLMTPPRVRQFSTSRRVFV